MIKTALILCLCATLSCPAQADTPLIVFNNLGGSIQKRSDEIKNLKKTGRSVELRGQICASSCTMYLGVPNVCVSRFTTFAFHGPTSLLGLRLPADVFEHWTQLMARHYKEPLKSWFMDEARFTFHGARNVSGQNIIAMGYPECPA